MSTPLPQPTPSARPWPTLATLWGCVIPISLFVHLCLRAVAPNDFWWHVRTGLLTLQTGAIPTVDLFSYTQAGQPWTNQAWLMQIALAWLYQTGGVALVILAHAPIITGGYTVAASPAWRETYRDDQAVFYWRTD